MGEPKHSLIIPFYRSASFLARTLDEVLEWFDGRGESFEVLAVDDGSPDETWSTLEAYKRVHPRPELRLLRHGANRGKGQAIRTGVVAARGRFIYFTDADLTYRLSSLAGLMAALEEGADLAIGCRTHRDSRYEVAPSFFPVLFRRHLMGRFFNLLVRLFVVPGIRDTQAGLKGFTREAAARIFPLGRLNRFSFDVELLFLARKLGFTIAERGVHFVYRKEPTTVRFLRDSFKMLRDMVRIRLGYHRGVYTGK